MPDVVFLYISAIFAIYHSMLMYYVCSSVCEGQTHFQGWYFTTKKSANIEHFAGISIDNGHEIVITELTLVILSKSVNQL